MRRPPSLCRTIAFVSITWCSTCWCQTPFDTLESWSNSFSANVFGLAWGDADNDGDLDLAIAGGESEPARVILNNNGVLSKNVFWTSSELTSWTLSWGDIDRDGDLDLCVASAVNRVYLNNSGILAKRASWQSADSNASNGRNPLALGDINGDQYLDLAVSNRLYRNIGGTFESLPSWRFEGLNVSALAFGQIDDGSGLDLVASYLSPSFQWTVSAFANVGGNLDDRAIWSDSSAPVTDFAVGDLDNDGFFDLVCAGRDWSVFVFYGTSGGLPESPAWHSTSSSPYAVTLADLNTDGFLDIVTANQRWQTPGPASPRGMYNCAYLSENGVFASPYPSWCSARKDTSACMAAGDLNNDGRLDILFGNIDGPLRLYINQQNRPSFELEADLTGNEIIQGVFNSIFDDIDGDGDEDLIVSSLALSEQSHQVSQITVYPNIGNALALDQAYLFTDECVSGVTLIDVDNDKDLDLIHGGRLHFTFDGHIEWMARDSIPGLGDCSTSETGVNVYSLATGDTNGDDSPEVVVGFVKVWYGNPIIGNISIYESSDGQIDSTPLWHLSSPDLSYSNVALVDISESGWLDLLVSNGRGLVAFTNRNGMIDTIPSLMIDGPHLKSLCGIAVGDVDSDGKPDIFRSNCTPITQVGNTGPSVFGFLSSRAGPDGDLNWNTESNGYSATIALADVNGDRKLDLLCTTDTSTDMFSSSSLALQVFLNKETGLSVQPDFVVGNVDGPFAFCDLGRDGDLDFAVGTKLFENKWQTSCLVSSMLPNDPPCMNDVSIDIDQRKGNIANIHLNIADFQADPCRLQVDYSLDGSNWYPATTSVTGALLTTSPDGVPHDFDWNLDADGVDGYNVSVCLRLHSYPNSVGQIQSPSRRYFRQLGRIDGRPHVELSFPEHGSVLGNYVTVIGKIWDNSNLSNATLLMGALPDTAWSIVYTIEDEYRQEDLLSLLNIGDKPAGDYVLRIVATDIQGNSRSLDRTVRIVPLPEGAPSVLQIFPPAGATDIQPTSPIAFKFDSNMNQASLNSNSAQLVSNGVKKESGYYYDFASQTLVVDPREPLETGMMHHVLLDGTFVALDGLTLTQDYVDYFSCRQFDQESNVIGIEPSRGQVGVSTSTLIKVKMTSPVAVPDIVIFTIDGDTSTIESVRHDPASETWEYRTTQLVGASMYFAVVRDLTSPNGEGYVSYFFTEDNSRPRIISHTPLDGAWLVDLHERIEVHLDKQINANSVDSASFRLIGPNGPISGVIGYGGSETTFLTLDPSEALEANTSYEVVLTPRIQDYLGHIIDSTAWTFTTGDFFLIGYEGGSISSDSYELAFNTGALKNETEIGIGFVPINRVNPGDPSLVAGTVIEIAPHVELQRPAILTLIAPVGLDETVDTLPSLEIRYLDPRSDEWYTLGGTTVSNKISVKAERLGTFGLFRSDSSVSVFDSETRLELIPRVLRPKSIGPNDMLRVAISTPQSVHLTARIYDTSGRLVKPLCKDISVAAGSTVLEWDGIDSGGIPANDGLYIIIAEVGSRRLKQTFVLLNN